MGEKVSTFLRGVLQRRHIGRRYLDQADINQIGDLPHRLPGSLKVDNGNDLAETSPLGFIAVKARKATRMALTALRSRLGIALAWVFNIWGSLDLLNAFYVANGAGLLAGQLGAAISFPR